MAKCNTQANDMATTVNNWHTPGASNPGCYNYGGDKRFIVKSYGDPSFDTDPDDSESRSGYILKVGTISLSSSMQSIVDIEICKIHMDLNVVDPLTNFSHKQNMITP